jgi:hypothetical protein
MGQKFCTVCGDALSEGVKFCESCGTPVELAPPVTGLSVSTAADPLPPPSAAPAVLPPPAGARKAPVKLIAGIVILLIIVAAVAVIVVLPGLSAGSSPLPGAQVSGTKAPVTVAMTTIAVTAAPVALTPVPASSPDPFPNALHLRDGFPFSSGSTASEGTVYRVWLNDTYHWHNDKDNLYYEEPNKGSKFLFVFVSVYNKADTRVYAPTQNAIKVHYNGQVYSPDPIHKLPDKSSNLEDTPVEIKEVQYFSKLFGSEYVEDYGYSHGTQVTYLYPGKSNAIDGYLIYRVPPSFTPDKGYAEIVFNGQDHAVWKLG